jgi:hypothetical protein
MRMGLLVHFAHRRQRLTVKRPLIFGVKRNQIFLFLKKSLIKRKEKENLVFQNKSTFLGSGGLPILGNRHSFGHTPDRMVACPSIRDSSRHIKNLIGGIPMYKRFSVCLSLLFLLTFLGSYAIAGEEDNILPNGSFEEIFNKKGVKNNPAANGVPSAATKWNQWINGGNEVFTEVIEDKDLVVDGECMIHITANGANSGLYMYYLQGNVRTVTYSAWVYVLSGKVGIANGSNAKGFDWAKSTKTNEWEFLVVTVDGVKIPEEVLIYSQDGAMDIYADAAWVNYGNKTTNPITTLKPKAVNSKRKLAVTWSQIKAQD